MGANKAEMTLYNQLRDDIKSLKQSITDSKTTPQPIGNGSINYAVLGTGIQWGATTIAAGATNTFYVTVLSHNTPLTYNGLPAINKSTLIDYLFSVYVDGHDEAHLYPLGSSIPSVSDIHTWCDLFYSSITQTDGHRTFFIQVTNKDSVSHTYYVDANALLPRPALQPQ